jgi:hypothetical protein
MPQPTTPTHFADSGPVAEALAVIERLDEIDPETISTILATMRRYQVGLTVGQAVPPVTACVLLYLAGTVGLAIPTPLLIGLLILSIGILPLTFEVQRRAFLAECMSLGLSKPLAKRLYSRLVRSSLRFQRGPRNEGETYRLLIGKSDRV